MRFIYRWRRTQNCIRRSASLADVPVAIEAVVTKGTHDFGDGDEDAHIVVDDTRLAGTDTDDAAISVADVK